VIPEEFVALAPSYPVLSELNPPQLRTLQPLVEDLHFEPGQIIFREGERSSYLHLIVAGDVALEETAAGQPIRVQMLHLGEAMGWSALTPAGRTHFQARALSPVSTIAFPGENLRLACERHPDLGYALMKQLLELVTERLDVTRIQLVAANPNPAREIPPPEIPH
jgi:CRP/FNR family cyclic AMP-dependent transcriptional regulator